MSTELRDVERTLAAGLVKTMMDPEEGTPEARAIAFNMQCRAVVALAAHRQADSIQRLAESLKVLVQIGRNSR